IFTSGQMPMAVAEDGKAPAWMAKLNGGGVPYWSVLLSSTLGAVLLCLNYSRGLIGAYTFLLMMTTALSLIYYFFCGVAEVKRSWRTSRVWTAVALFACVYSLFALIGSGVEVSLWGGALMLVGFPFYFLFKSRKASVLNPAS